MRSGRLAKQLAISAAASALIAVMAACSSSNPVCAPDVRDRLLEDCQLSTSPVSSASCVALPGAPAPGGLRVQGALDHQDATCEVYDLQGVDADCLKTTACADLYAGACTSSGTVSVSIATCLSACRDALSTCDDACATTSSDYDACLNCQVDCIDPLVRCENTCRDAESG